MTVSDNSVPRDVPPFRADHVGSFLRPESVRKARLEAQQGLISPEELRAVEDDAIRALVKKEKECGLRAVTDGEFRRSWWHYDFFAGLEGIEKVAAEKPLAFHGVQPRAEKVVLTGRVDFTGRHPHCVTLPFCWPMPAEPCPRCAFLPPRFFTWSLLSGMSISGCRPSMPMRMTSWKAWPLPTGRRSGHFMSKDAVTCSSTIPAGERCAPRRNAPGWSSAALILTL